MLFWFPIFRKHIVNPKFVASGSIWSPIGYYPMSISHDRWLSHRMFLGIFGKPPWRYSSTRFEYYLIPCVSCCCSFSTSYAHVPLAPKIASHGCHGQLPGQPSRIYLVRFWYSSAWAQRWIPNKSRLTIHLDWWACGSVSNHLMSQ